MSAGRGARAVRLGLGFSAGLLVAACSSVGGFVGDHLPKWAGGLPPGTPPRAGAPGYDAYLKSVGEGQPTASVPPADAPAPTPRTPEQPTH